MMMMMMATTTKASSNVGVREKHRRRHYLSRLQKSRHHCRRDKSRRDDAREKWRRRGRRGGDDDGEKHEVAATSVQDVPENFPGRRANTDGGRFIQWGAEIAEQEKNVSLPEVPDVEDVKELMTRDPRELIPEIEVPELEDVVEDAKPFLAKLADGVKRSFAKRNIKVPKSSDERRGGEGDDQGEDESTGSARSGWREEVVCEAKHQSSERRGGEGSNHGEDKGSESTGSARSGWREEVACEETSKFRASRR